MSFTGDLLKGLAAYLAAGGVGTYQAAGNYPPSAVTPIFLGDMPASPDRLIVLSAYPVDDDPAKTDSTIGVQARTRGLASNAGSVDTLDDEVFDRLHGAEHLVLNGIHVVQILRRSGAPMGVDGNRRFGRTSNYYVQAARPSAHRTD